MKQQDFKVYGRGEFPVDMLRYDRCWPRSSVDSSLIAYPGGNHRRSITLSRYVDNRWQIPATERWASFGWTVEDVETGK